MFQNHILQILSLVAMEPPIRFSADALRNEKVKVFSAIRPLSMADTVQAQYEGYRQAQGVAPDSRTPTFAAMKLFIDNWRWQDVPFYLRSGKALHRKTSEVTIQFRRPPQMLFEAGSSHTPNAISLAIQPDEGIFMRFDAKMPGTAREATSVQMDFRYKDVTSEPLPDAYERLLLDAMNGDASLFIRRDEIELSWGVVDCMLADTSAPIVSYPKNSWGPDESDELMRRDGREWILNCCWG
jgi:glucose-6-phosphate 1-dehydrogenase